MRITLFFLALLLLGMPLAAAHTGHDATELADPGAVPGDLFYTLDRAGEALSIWTTFSSTPKARQKLRFAEERLAEALAIADRRPERAAALVRTYERNVQRAVGIGRTLRSTGDDDAGDLIATASRTTARHMSILEHRGIAPGDVGYDAKRMAEDTTVATEPDPLERARKQAAVAGHRVNEMDRLAAANLSVGIPELARAYDRELQTLHDIAGNVSETRTRHAVNEIIATATQRHQQALQDVMGRVPPEAQEALRFAMQVSETGNNRAVDALRSTGGVPSGIRVPGGRSGDRPDNRSGADDGTEGETDGNASRTVEESFGMNASQG